MPHEEPGPAPEDRRAIPPDLETIVLKAIAREPSHRYESAAEMADDLRSFLEGRPILARRIGPMERLGAMEPAQPRPGRVDGGGAPGPLLRQRGDGVLWRRAENQRRRADELLVLSEKQRLDAERSRATERSRADAQAHFTKARAAVDELLTRVSQSQL